MTTTSILDPIVGRVDRLLQHHIALEQMNRQLADEVQALQQERDLLRSRLKAARARVDALIERLPVNQETP
jgi:cell division protein ZapB